MAKCLRCGADSAWIQGRVSSEAKACDEGELIDLRADNDQLREQNEKLIAVVKAAKEYRDSVRLLYTYDDDYPVYEVCKRKAEVLDAALAALTDAGVKLEDS